MGAGFYVFSFIFWLPRASFNFDTLKWTEGFTGSGIFGDEMAADAG